MATYDWQSQQGKYKAFQPTGAAANYVPGNNPANAAWLKAYDDQYKQWQNTPQAGYTADQWKQLMGSMAPQPLSAGGQAPVSAGGSSSPIGGPSGTYTPGQGYKVPPPYTGTVQPGGYGGSLSGDVLVNPPTFPGGIFGSPGSPVLGMPGSPVSGLRGSPIAPMGGPSAPAPGGAPSTGGPSTPVSPTPIPPPRLIQGTYPAGTTNWNLGGSPIAPQGGVIRNQWGGSVGAPGAGALGAAGGVPQQSLPSGPVQGYDPSTGGVPTVPSPTGTQAGAIAGNLGNFGGISQLGLQTGALNAQLGALPYQANLPNYQGLLGQASGNALSNLQGILPADVRQQIAQAGAERGVATGSPNSPNANAAMLRALGLTSLGLQQAGQQQFGQLMGLTPTGPSFNPSSLFVSPEQFQAAQAAANLYASAPIPSYARNAAFGALNQGLNRGQAQTAPTQSQDLVGQIIGKYAPTATGGTPSWGGPVAPTVPGGTYDTRPGWDESDWGAITGGSVPDMTEQDWSYITGGSDPSISNEDWSYITGGP